MCKAKNPAAYIGVFRLCLELGACGSNGIYKLLKYEIVENAELSEPTRPPQDKTAEVEELGEHTKLLENKIAELVEPIKLQENKIIELIKLAEPTKLKKMKARILWNL